jgi:hypothetical protein
VVPPNAPVAARQSTEEGGLPRHSHPLAVHFGRGFVESERALDESGIFACLTGHRSLELVRHRIFLSEWPKLTHIVLQRQALHWQAILPVVPMGSLTSHFYRGITTVRMIYAAKLKFRVL